MRIGIIGQKWIGQEVFSRLAREAEIAFVAAPDENDRLAKAAIGHGILPYLYGGGRGLAGLQHVGYFDLLVTVGSFAFVPAELRQLAAWSIGYHPSLLPLYRGPTAIADAIAAGDRVTGGTVYLLSDDYDAGPVVFQDWCFIHDGETAGELWQRALGPMGVDLVSRAADHLEAYGFLPADDQQDLSASRSAELVL